MAAAIREMHVAGRLDRRAAVTGCTGDVRAGRHGRAENEATRQSGEPGVAMSGNSADRGGNKDEEKQRFAFQTAREMRMKDEEY